MSASAIVTSVFRSLAISAATGALVLGVLVALHPFDTTVAAVTASPALSALETQIAQARDALRQTETALASVNGASQLAGPSGTGALDAQLAAAIDRADLARRHAQAIRDALASGREVASLAEIRDSVVVGQLLAQRSALEAEIAEQGARLGPSHPTMRALEAQRRALLAQISAQAAAIATALEAEATIEDSEISRLRSALGTPDAPTNTGDPIVDLRRKADLQQAELDRLMDAYFQEKSAPGTVLRDPLAGITNPINLLCAGLAALAALVIQLAIGLERRQARRRANADLDAWVADQDTIAALTTPVAPLPKTELRRAS